MLPSAKRQKRFSAEGGREPKNCKGSQSKTTRAEGHPVRTREDMRARKIGEGAAGVARSHADIRALALNMQVRCTTRTDEGDVPIKTEAGSAPSGGTDGRSAPNPFDAMDAPR